MDLKRLLVLVINDMVIFPNNEVRIEYDNIYDHQMIDIVDNIEDNLMIIVNPLEEDTNIDVTSLPKYGVLSRLKLKMTVPNGKTRLVIEGIERVELINCIQEDKFFKANYQEVNIENNDSDGSYYNILLKSLEKYINKVPYMGNAVMTQLEKVDNLSDLCDLISCYVNLDYSKKKKYITIIDPIERSKRLIEDMNENLKFIELEQKIEQEVEQELNETQKEYFL